MKLSKRISLIEKYLTKRDIKYFRSSLKKFMKLILEMKEANPKASILDCIEKYNRDLQELVLTTHQVRYGDLFKYIAIESLLNSKEKGSILRRANERLDISELGRNVEFNGNLNHDYDSLVKFYFQEEVLRYEILSAKLQQNPGDNRIRKEMQELSEKFEKFKVKNLSTYEMTKLQNEQLESFGNWRKIFKNRLQDDLSKSIIKKILFLKKIGCLSEYEDSYNKTVDYNYLPSALRIRDKETFDSNLIDYKKFRNYSVAELVALNAFWTNKLVKEVEKWNEVIYVIINSNNFSSFKDGVNFDLADEDIIYYLSEYRGLTPYITAYKHSDKMLEDAQNFDNKNDELVFAKFDIKKIFSREDIEYYGYNELEGMLQSVIFLNDRSQLLYDQKDIAMEEMIGFILNTKEYGNAGISLESDDNKSTNKPMIVVDLKGVNAPIMLHIDMDSVKRRVRIVSGDSKIPLYRGGKDIIKDSAQDGMSVIKSNIVFKLDSEQRKALIARAGCAGLKDTNAAYLMHIAWMTNPKKDMPEFIREPKRVIDLETGEISDISEEQEVKRSLA